MELINITKVELTTKEKANLIETIKILFTIEETMAKKKKSQLGLDTGHFMITEIKKCIYFLMDLSSS